MAYFKRVLIASVLAMASTLLMLTLYAMICCFFGVSADSASTVVFIVSVLCVAIWAFISSRRLEKGGIVHGSAVGALYGAVVLAACLAVGGGSSFGVHTIIAVVAAVAAGAFGGIVGINSK